jgi:hypothetical protein
MQSERAIACLEKAAECERRSALASDEAIRKTYLDLAIQWRSMANQAQDLQRRQAR